MGRRPDQLRILIIGSGYAGACAARLLTDAGHEVHVFEKAAQPGGMARSFQLEGMTYEFGPHVLANHHCTPEAIDFITQHIEVEPTTMATSSYLQEQHFSYPPYRGDFHQLREYEQIQQELASLSEACDETNFQTYLLSRVGPTLYHLFYEEFTRKFWQVEPSALDANWAKTRCLGEGLDQKQMFFNERWCTYPKHDFNELIDNLFRGIQLHMNTEIAEIDLKETSIVDSQGERFTGDILISTLSIDRLFQSVHGELDYTGYDIQPEIVERDYFHPAKPGTKQHYGMVYYPEPEVPWCRITEYKCFNNKAEDEAYAGRTIITKEIPTRKAKFYPFCDERNETLLRCYLEELAKYPRVFSLGRMGLYKYTTIDTTTEQVFRFLDQVGQGFQSWTTKSPEQKIEAYYAIRGGYDN